MHAGNEIFGNNSAGSPFTVYAIGNYTAKGGNTNSKYAEPRRVWQFAVKAGDSVMYEWPLQDFENENYHLRLYGPNGFFREFAGTKMIWLWC